MGNILQKDTSSSLLEAIRQKTVFGFAVCDVTTEPELISKISGNGFLFPPVIQRLDVDETMMSQYMKSRFIEEGVPMKKTTVVQTFNCKQQLLMTPLLEFYMRLGLKVSNISQFIQFVPGKALKPFANKVYRMRCEATREGDDAKSLTSKLFGNSGKFLIVLIILIVKS